MPTQNTVSREIQVWKNCAALTLCEQIPYRSRSGRARTHVNDSARIAGKFGMERRREAAAVLILSWRTIAFRRGEAIQQRRMGRSPLDKLSLVVVHNV
ncbi:hypothetical protein [Bradyrhizobium sp. 153]|uniref:hypothetical protein n=1 Tax=Bradyrhizobium sp. 153 TaxID=2782627 RepID=UPI001FFB5D44|nr:hypothetical protein [Bradyrhizobium sp. 153]MCK1663541.1 hypothetical protein [Bradyrhizobium sp. 153]